MITDGWNRMERKQMWLFKGEEETLVVMGEFQMLAVPYACDKII